MLPAGSKSLAVQPVLAEEKIGHVSAFGALREGWGDLLQASAADSLFLTWEWLHTWWKHLAGDRELSILAARCDGELVAVAPLCVRPRSLRGLRPLPVSEILGSGAAGSDYLDFIVRRGWEAEAHGAFAANLHQPQSMLRWTNVAWTKPSAAAVAYIL